MVKIEHDIEPCRRTARGANNTNPGALCGPAIAIPHDRTDDVDLTARDNGDDSEYHSTSTPSRDLQDA